MKDANTDTKLGMLTLFHILPRHSPPMTARIESPSNDFIQLLDKSLKDSQSQEQLVRPLLELLQAVTGLQSTFLTQVDTENDEQEILFSYNTDDSLQIPEQLTTTWSDALCRRALLEGWATKENTTGYWADSHIARKLGVATYAVMPVHDENGNLLGTLCAASNETRTIVEGLERLMEMFAHLIEKFIKQERLIQQLHQAQQALRQSADTDALTGMPNRRALLMEMDRRMRQHAEAGTDMIVGFIDMDDFKAINDQYGHAVGDRFLSAVAEKLRRGQRPEDYCARLGGDEFVTLTSLRHHEVGDLERQLRDRIQAATSGRFDVGEGIIIDYPGASVGFTRGRNESQPTALISRADRAMYKDKHRRQRSQTQST